VHRFTIFPSCAKASEVTVFSTTKETLDNPANPRDNGSVIVEHG